MDYIKDKSGTIVLAFDEENIYYHSQEPDEDSELDELISFDLLRANNNGGLKLYTILKLQEELGIITDLSYVVSNIKKNFPLLSQIIQKHEDSILSLNERIILLEVEGSGPASAWEDFLYLVIENGSFNLCSSRKGLISSSEIIEYYGFDDNDYWGQIQANGEFIEQYISHITTSKALYEGINSILTNDVQWMMKIDEIDWKSIVDVLLNNKATNQVGNEIKSFIYYK